MSADSKHRYKFGDSQIAAERLRLLASAFAPSSRAFLARLQPRPPRTIADVGCGPGYTTQLLAELFPSASIRGIDFSESFVASAERTRQSPNISFEISDITQPLPGRPYDLIYARYVLTHVADFDRTIDSWATQLTQAGAIAIEENQGIETKTPAFREYLTMVEAMLAEDGQRLFVGAELDTWNHSPSLHRTTSELTPVALSQRVAAELFLPNLQTWRSRPFIQKNYRPSTVDQLAIELQEMVHEVVDTPAITFWLRQVVLRREWRN